MFIAFEGGDGAGKTTQIQLLAGHFRAQGRAVTICREPGSTPLGEQVRDVLLHRDDLHICRWSELFLFMTARAQMVAEVVRPALARGEVVLTDRFLLSSVVYQGYGGELGPDIIREIGLHATGGLLPDMTFILDISLEVAEQRRVTAPDRMESQGDAFHRRVRDGFLAEACRTPETIKVISAEQPADRIFEAILWILEK